VALLTSSIDFPVWQSPDEFCAVRSNGFVVQRSAEFGHDVAADHKSEAESERLRGIERRKDLLQEASATPGPLSVIANQALASSKPVSISITGLIVSLSASTAFCTRLTTTCSSLIRFGEYPRIVWRQIQADKNSCRAKFAVEQQDCAIDDRRKSNRITLERCSSRKLA
jgi:hypothetical protein